MFPSTDAADKRHPEGIPTGKLPTMKNNCTKGISQLSEDRWLKHSILSPSLSPFSCFYWAGYVLFAQSLFTRSVFAVCSSRVHFGCLYLLMTHWVELGAINSAEHEFTRQTLDWQCHLMCCPCHITVSFYDPPRHTHSRNLSSCFTYHI